MKKFLLSVLLLIIVMPVHAATVRLDGPLTQGGLVIGHTEPGTAVTLDGQSVRVAPNGVFLIAFARDAKPTARLSLTGNGKTEVRDLAIAPRDWNIQRIDGLPPKHVTPDPKIIKRIRTDNEKIYAVRALDTQTQDFLAGFDWPLVGRISGVFGSQRILNGKPRSPHSGVDIAAPTGAPIVACADGVVALVHQDMFYTGKTVMIDHGQGLSSVYGHMSKIDVTEGQHVTKGQVIAHVGRTGRATGPHLHWGMSLFTTKIDPALLLPPMPKSK